MNEADDLINLITDMDLSEAGLEPKERYLFGRVADQSAWTVTDTLTGEVVHQTLDRRDAVLWAVDLNRTTGR